MKDECQGGCCGDEREDEGGGCEGRACCGEGKGCCCCGGGRDDGDRDGREHRGGPPDTGFLDLEISQVLYAEAAALARDVTRDLLKEQIHARLRERLGERLAKIAVLAADELADDVEANLAIEAKIAERREQRASTKDRLRAALAGDAKPAPDAEGSSGRDPER